MTDDSSADGIAGTGIELGTTLYSMTSEFAAGLYTPETLIAAVAENGIGPGVEFNIAQLLRTYPDVDADFVTLWFDSLEKYGLEPSAVGTNLDMGRRKDRDMTPDEEHDFLARQLKTAHTLGFKRVVIRSAGRELLRSLLPLAEKYDQRLGYEIHAPQGPNDPKVLGIRGKLLHDTGAYTLQDPNIPYNSASTMSGPYVIPALSIEITLDAKLG